MIESVEKRRIGDGSVKSSDILGKLIGHKNVLSHLGDAIYGIPETCTNKYWNQAIVLIA